jgi:hypothetical protein
MPGLALKWLRLLLVPLLLVVVALVLGGVGGILLAFVAGLLVTDSVLERLIGGTGFEWLDAERRFLRVRRQRRRAALQRRLHHERGDRPLAYLADDTGWAARAQRRRLGEAPIEIGSIVGTSDRHKAQAFDAEFRPPEWSRGRWTLLCLAAQRGTPLPPISVYRVGGEHYVRDGHHRVSVARAIGSTRIDADIVELLRVN